ncbi:MAG: type II toxin-antitoxin system RelE/ParE family toxin [Pseudomonadales bacterium]|nr:type II toxin-antitoxin system RelE/ParE family toxin [Pseudomonadales bacterium]
MDYQVIWSPEALDDVDEIAAYIHKDSPIYAHSVVEQIIKKSNKLNKLPLRGRVVPELQDENYREVFIYSYRMVYHINEDVSEVKIVAVIHGARLLPEDLPVDD